MKDDPASRLTSYDQFPYPSHPFSQTHPDRLASVARLFGMQPERVDRCRVLELGCASGGNLIPLAECFPESEFVGIDLSSRQVGMGQEAIARLGLTNVQLQTMNILDVDESLGEFDYLICHGIYSWVPQEVQEGIFAACRQRLRSQGVAYISYNTYPGWHMRRMIRDMMCYHTQRIAEPERRVHESRSLLDFLAKAASAEKNAYAMLLQSELNLLSRCSDSYLFHEHLEDVNEPVYFHQFVQRAREHKLDYLGEAAASAMWSGNLPAEVRGTIVAASSDVVQLEQYIDFVLNRTFRQTLLCHDRIRANRQLSADHIRNFYVAAPFKAAQPQIRLHSYQPETFHVGSTGHSITTADPMVKAALVRLAETWPKWIHYDQLFAECCQLLKINPVQDARSMAKASEGLAGTLMQGFAHGYLELHTVPAQFTLEPGDKPMASRLARQQSQDGSSVTTRRHEAINLAGTSQRLLPLLDGSRTREELVAELSRMVDRQELVMQGIETEAARSQQVLQRTLSDDLHRLARAALLVA